VRPRALWSEEELRAYNGSKDGIGSPNAPILLAADGLVFNVSPARNLYGPGAEYAIMAGRDASRFLARNTVELAAADAAGAPLSLAEKASLGAWAFSLRRKYDVVGRLASVEEAVAMREAAQRTEAYMDELEKMSGEMGGGVDGGVDGGESELNHPSSH
jgi:membrane-associated progesterone receptor component